MGDKSLSFHVLSAHLLGQSFSCAAFLLILVTQIITTVPSCYGLIQLPVRESRLLHPEKLRKDSIGVDTVIGSRLVRREAPSPEEIAAMENNLNGISGNGYYIDVDIGTPPQKMQLLVDTGSANLAVACEDDSNLNHYFHRDQSSTFKDKGTNIYVPYTEGEWSGKLGTDVVGITTAQNLTATAYVSCITSSKDFYLPDAQWQGILGLSYALLARPDASYIPLWDSLTKEHSDLDDVFSMQLCGNSFVHTKDKPLMDGSLILGGIDPTMGHSDILYTPVYKQWYYEVVLTDLQVGGISLDLDCKELNLDKTIVDSGTTLVRLPVKVFDATVEAIQNSVIANKMEGYTEPGEEFYRGVTVLCYPDMGQPFQMFPIVSFELMETPNSTFTLHLTPQHYLRAVEAIDLGTVASELEQGQVCVKFGFAPSESGTVLGAVLMEAFYVVFDHGMSRVGFAQTTCPLPDPDHPVLDVTISGPDRVSGRNIEECAYKKPEPEQRSFIIATYIMAAVSIAVILPAVFLFFTWTKRMSRRADGYQQQFTQ